MSVFNFSSRGCLELHCIVGFEQRGPHRDGFVLVKPVFGGTTVHVADYELEPYLK